MQPFQCPVCLGTQRVPVWKYLDAEKTDNGQVVCRSCKGTGVVWPPQIDPWCQTSPEPFSMPAVELPCTCPPELKEGKIYVGDNFCARHGLNPLITSTTANCGCRYATEGVVSSIAVICEKHSRKLGE